MSNVDVFSNFLHLLIQGPNSFKKLNSRKSNEKTSKILVPSTNSNFSADGVEWGSGDERE